MRKAPNYNKKSSDKVTLHAVVLIAPLSMTGKAIRKEDQTVGGRRPKGDSSCRCPDCSFEQDGDRMGADSSCRCPDCSFEHDGDSIGAMREGKAIRKFVKQIVAIEDHQVSLRWTRAQTTSSKLNK